MASLILTDAPFELKPNRCVIVRLQLFQCVEQTICALRHRAEIDLALYLMYKDPALLSAGETVAGRTRRTRRILGAFFLDRAFP